MSAEKKKIFLTGINGFLGSHIALKLTNQGHTVYGLVRNNNRARILKDIPIQYCPGELLKPETYEAALKNCDVVIHTAAIASFGLKNPEEYFKVNYEGTKILLEQAQKNKIKRFIHTSSRGTLGVAQHPEESDETCSVEDLNKRNDYIKSK